MIIISLYLGFLAFGFFGFIVFRGAEGAMQECVGGLSLLASVLCLVGAGVIDKLSDIEKLLKSSARPTGIPPEMPTSREGGNEAGRVPVAVSQIVSVSVLGAIVIGIAIWLICLMRR